MATPSENGGCMASNRAGRRTKSAIRQFPGLPVGYPKTREKGWREKVRRHGAKRKEKPGKSQ